MPVTTGVVPTVVDPTKEPLSESGNKNVILEPEPNDNCENEEDACNQEESERNEGEEECGSKKCDRKKSSNCSFSSKILLCGSESKRKEIIDENNPQSASTEGTNTSKGRKSCRKGSKKNSRETIPLSNIEQAPHEDPSSQISGHFHGQPSTDQSIGSTATGGGTNNKNNKTKCHFCWCCCCSCSSLKSCLVKNGDKNNKDSNKNEVSSLDHFFNGNDEPELTLEEVKSWGDSFEKLMKSHQGRRVFREFLKCEYSEENILFYAACEDLKNGMDEEKVEEKCRLIYDNYVSILSPREVSLDSQVREVINKNMMKPSKETFEEAQVQIYTLMQRDSYPRFVNSANYKQVLQQHQTPSSTTNLTSSTAQQQQLQLSSTISCGGKEDDEEG